MTQLTFGNMDMPVHRARASDPDTSKAAAAHVERTGLAARQAQAVLDAVKRWPGLTSRELWVKHKAAGGLLDRHDFARRLPELANHGLVRNGTARQCQSSGMKAMTWEAC